MSHLVLTAKKISGVISDKEFRTKFPEFSDYYKQHDRIVEVRKAQKKCTRCGSTGRFLGLIVARIRGSRSLALRIKDHFGVDELKYIIRSPKGAEVEKLA